MHSWKGRDDGLASRVHADAHGDVGFGTPGCWHLRPVARGQLRPHLAWLAAHCRADGEAWKPQRARLAGQRRWEKWWAFIFRTALLFLCLFLLASLVEDTGQLINCKDSLKSGFEKRNERKPRTSQNQSKKSKNQINKLKSFFLDNWISL